MDEYDEKADTRRIILLWSSLGLGCLVVLSVAFFFLWPNYQSWAQNRSLREARKAHEEQEYRREQLLLEQAVQTDPANTAARRRLAEFYEWAGSPRSMELWSELVRAEPEKVENHLGLGLATLRFGSLKAALDVLASMPSSLHEREDYHRLAAALAAASGDLVKLEKHLEFLKAKVPSDENLRFVRASLGVHANSEDKRKEAVLELEAFARSQNLRIRAVLQLLRYETKPGTSRELVLEKVIARVLPPPGGKLRFLGISKRGVWDLIDYMQAQAPIGAADAAELVDWMRGQGLAREALFWISSLSPILQQASELQRARAACLLQIRDWKGLQDIVMTGVWGTISADVAQLAFASRVQREFASLTHAKATWMDALDIAQKNPSSFTVLLRLAQEWGWKDEQEKVLWRMARVSPREPRAWLALLERAETEGSSDRVYQVLQEWRRAVPENPALQAQFLLLCIVLGRAEATHRMELAMLAKTPTAPPAAKAGQAYLLAQAKRTGEAQALLVGFIPSPSLGLRTSLICGLAQLLCGKKEQAALYLHALVSEKLLPEEKNLLEASLPQLVHLLPEERRPSQVPSRGN